MTDRLETGLVWHRGKSRCESGACAEVARNGDVVLLRRHLTRTPRLPSAAMSGRQLRADMKEGDFDNV